MNSTNDVIFCDWDYCFNVGHHGLYVAVFVLIFIHNPESLLYINN